ncbi:MAG: pentapeptide repeat-containing protein [Methylocystis sp.]
MLNERRYHRSCRARGSGHPSSHRRGAAGAWVGVNPLCRLEFDGSRPQRPRFSWLRIRALPRRPREARFLFCDFNNTKWRGTMVSSAFFQDCKLTGAQMAVANTLMSPAFERCLLINANLRGLSFRRGQLDGVDFQGADLRDADFRDSVLTDCSLREANVTKARFEGADLRGADLGSLQLADASRFKGAIISKKQAGELLSGLGLKVV